MVDSSEFSNPIVTISHIFNVGSAHGVKFIVFNYFVNEIRWKYRCLTVKQF